MECLETKAKECRFKVKTKVNSICENEGQCKYKGSVIALKGDKKYNECIIDSYINETGGQE